MRSCLTSLILVASLARPAAAQEPSRPVVALPDPSATLDAEFTLVGSVRELADGRVLVLDQSEQKLFVADWARGTVVLVGRQGSGPGEYGLPAAMLATRGDSTIVADLQNGRWLMLHGAQVAGTVSPDAPVLIAGARRPLGADEAGRVIFTRGLGSGTSVTVTRPRIDSLLLLRAERASGRVDTVAMLRARKSEIRVTGPADRPTSVDVMTSPLASAEQAALFGDGWIAIARHEPYRVDWRSPDGRLSLGKALPFERVRLDADEQEAFAQRQAARTGRPRRDPKLYPEWPEILPAFLTDGLLAAPDGRLWIRRPPSAAQTAPPYDVIDRAGQLVARVGVGANVQVVGFGRGVVYTVETDEDGIQRLQRRPQVPR